MKGVTVQMKRALTTRASKPKSQFMTSRPLGDCVPNTAAFTVQQEHGDMKTMKFRLILDTEFDPCGCTPEDLRRNLNQVVRDAVNNGTLTGSLPATVESYNYSVKLIRPPKRGRRCTMRGCKNVATHKVYNAGCDPFLVCRTHHKSFSKAYRTKPLKKLKRYPIQKILEHVRNRPPEPPSPSEPHSILTDPGFLAIL